MGLIYSSSESENLSSSLSNNLNQGKNVVNQLKSGSQKVVEAVDGQILAGAAYTAGKGLFSELIIPTVDRVTNSCESIAKELVQYNSANSLISGEAYLDEDILMNKITSRKNMKSSVDSSLKFAKLAIKANPVAAVLDSLLKFQDNLTKMSDGIQDKIDELEEQLKKLRIFSSQTSSLFSDSLESLKLAMQSVLVLNGTIVNSDGTYSLPVGTDLSWFTQLQGKKEVADLKEAVLKEQYIRTLQEQFGFDEVTAKQIYKIKEGLDKKFPKLSQQQRDYLLARILGEFSYGDSTKNSLMWNNTAGALGDYFYTIYNNNYGNPLIVPQKLDEILSSLGLSEQEYKELYYNLRLQHELSAGELDIAENLRTENYNIYKEYYEEAYGKISDKEFSKFWNQKLVDFKNKGDFTHQSITTATILDENIHLGNLSGILTGSFDSQTLDELAGWRGDTTNVPAEKPSIGNDDYKADLDAVNISQIMKDKNISYSQASNEYYTGLAANTINRAEEFKNNSGFDYVKNEILNAMTPVQECNQYGVTHLYSTEERMAYLKENYPESYNFILSLANNDNDYVDYASKGN